MDQGSATSFQSPEWQKKIADKLALIRSVDDSFPGVIIVHNILDSKPVYMSPMGLKLLGITLEELLASGAEYHTRYFNPEDSKDYVPKIIGLLEKNNDDEVISVFQQVRTAPDKDWNWYLSGAKIFMRDDEGKPLLTISFSIPVDAQHHIAAKAQRLLEENNFLRHNYHAFDQLTKREKEILRLLALGLSSAQIAARLHISEPTASTHRRNIKKKLHLKTSYDVSRFARAFDLI